MFEKIGQVAEQAATSVSRRQFLGRFGQGALIVAAAVGALLALPAVTQGQGGWCGPNSVSPRCRNKPEGTPCNLRGTVICIGAPMCQCKNIYQ
jgi:hypothetical protein